MDIILTNIYIFVMAVVLAVLEIQIEGAHGWAKNLPTWRPKNPNFFTKLYKGVMSGKEMTGYHLSMFALVFLIFGLPYVFGMPLTLEDGFKTFSFYLLFCAVWDFYWFVLNPWYPLSKFKKEHLDFHHPTWFLGIPTDYWGATMVSLVLCLTGQFFLQMPDLLSWWAINYLLFIIETVLLVLFSLYILKIDKWHPQE